ncbi:hypothetical protein [Streptomyces atratus]|uniref:hypothetical protein n=1 Tax=Streptomyces atratus TaxID=1893 RepID=UPI001300892A|nr:hypothetical protein [Streptomyces atratus]
MNRTIFAGWVIESDRTAWTMALSGSSPNAPSGSLGARRGGPVPEVQGERREFGREPGVCAVRAQRVEAVALVLLDADVRGDALATCLRHGITDPDRIKASRARAATVHGARYPRLFPPAAVTTRYRVRMLNRWYVVRSWRALGSRWRQVLVACTAGLTAAVSIAISLPLWPGGARYFEGMCRRLKYS